MAVSESAHAQKGEIMEANPYQSPSSADLGSAPFSGPATRRLIRIAPVQLGIVLGSIYVIISIPLILVFWLIASVMPMGSQMHFHAAMLALPILYGIFGFIFAAFGSLIYNLVARFTGGIEYTVGQAP